MFWRCFIVIFHMHLKTNILITLNLVQIMHSDEVELIERYGFKSHTGAIILVLTNAILERPVDLVGNKSILYGSLRILTLELDDEHKFYICLPNL